MSVDRDLANLHGGLAKKVQLLPGLDARLACIDTRAGEDKYHVLQGLKDKTKQGDPKCCYFYQRSGSTGTRGAITVEGPMVQPKVMEAFAAVFKEKTGAGWGALKAGAQAKPGKFWLQQQATPDLKAKWQYYVADGVDGKKTGWYPYDQSASDEVEELLSQHLANERGSRTATRLVSSAYFTYKVDLDDMKQTNQRTKKVRTIRRAQGAEINEAPQARAGSKGALKTFRKAMKVIKKATKKKSMKAMKKKKVMKKVMKKKAMKKVMKKKKMTPKQIALARKKRSKIGTKWEVMSGQKEKTKAGYKKADLVKSKTNGKIVTRKKQAMGKKNHGNIQAWVMACKKAREALGITGFVAIRKGTTFYNKAKELLPTMPPALLRKMSTKSVVAEPPALLRKGSSKSGTGAPALVRKGSTKSI